MEKVVFAHVPVSSSGGNTLVCCVHVFNFFSYDYLLGK